MKIDKTTQNIIKIQIDSIYKKSFETKTKKKGEKADKQIKTVKSKWK